MDNRKEEITRRPFYIYDLPNDILETLQRKVDVDTDASYTEVEQNIRISGHEQNEPASVWSKACSLCNIIFPTVEDQRGHVRSDWHGYNLKQKLRGLQAVSEDNFEKLVGDLDESLSGSDLSESDDEDIGRRKDTTLSALLKKQAVISGNTGTNLDDGAQSKKRSSGEPPLFWFNTSILPPNIYLGIYRAVFTNSEQENEYQLLDTIRNKQVSLRTAPKPHPDVNNGGSLPLEYNEPHIFLCMIGGGHFAAMVVAMAPRQTKISSSGPFNREATVLAHKTFHRYTTRRKQGGSQSANDSAKGAAHSAGSNLRRYNEAALTDEVRLLLTAWKGMIDSSELLFVRATGNTNRRTLFGPYDGQVLRQSDPRLRGFPFNTRRATQQELMRAFIELSRVKVQEINETAKAAAAEVTAEASKQELLAKAKGHYSPVIPKRSDEEEIAILHTTQLQALTRRSKLPGLLSYLTTNILAPNFFFHPRDSRQNYHAPTLLHFAASLNLPTIVTGLLTRTDANPCILNGDGKPPFDLAGDRATRDAFRVARSTVGESKWDWDAAHVPSGLSKPEAEDRTARERQENLQKEEERRRAETERLKFEGPKIGDTEKLGKSAGRGRALALGHVQRSAQEQRDEETRGLLPEVRARLERERRARAAEERIRKMQVDG